MAERAGGRRKEECARGFFFSQSVKWERRGNLDRGFWKRRLIAYVHQICRQEFARPEPGPTCMHTSLLLQQQQRRDPISRVLLRHHSSASVIKTCKFTQPSPGVIKVVKMPSWSVTDLRILQLSWEQPMYRKLRAAPKL